MENVFNVQKKQWKKWTPLARAVFNDVYFAMSDQHLFLHPEATFNSALHWNTTAWNAAWIAADSVKDNRVFAND